MSRPSAGTAENTGYYRYHQASGGNTAVGSATNNSSGSGSSSSSSSGGSGSSSSSSGNGNVLSTVPTNKTSGLGLGSGASSSLLLGRRPIVIPEVYVSPSIRGSGGGRHLETLLGDTPFI